MSDPTSRARVAVVSGGSRGLGLEAACGLVHAGYVVIAGSRGRGSFDDARDALDGEVAGRLHHRPLDVGVSESVTDFFAEVAREFGVPDVLVNNAGIEHQSRFQEVVEADWNNVINVNLNGTFRCSQAFVRAAVTRPSQGRSIINVASLAASVGVRGQAAYCASKGAVVSLTRALAVELASQQIRVNAIAPGYFQTDMPRLVLEDPAHRDRLVQSIPQRRVPLPQEIAGTVVYLAGSASMYVTGAVIAVDGGYTAV